jgi:hypothetical protein
MSGYLLHVLRSELLLQRLVICIIYWHSPYMPELLCYKTEFRDGTESYSEVFDTDDPTLSYRYPTYDTDTHLGDRSPTGYNHGRPFLTKCCQISSFSYGNRGFKCVKYLVFRKKILVSDRNLKNIWQHFVKNGLPWLYPIEENQIPIQSVFPPEY